MILDTSVVVAVVRREPIARRLLEKMDAAEQVGIGTPTLVEASIVLTRRMGAAGPSGLLKLLEEQGALYMPFEYRHWRAAEDAFIRFGKGRHAAALNLGDCMTYATASVAGQPLLFIGDDFARTDIAPA